MESELEMLSKIPFVDIWKRNFHTEETSKFNESNLFTDSVEVIQLQQILLICM